MPSADVNIVRAQTDVGIDQKVFEELVADLGRDPEMLRFNTTFATAPTGGGISTNLQSMARLLLARVIATDDLSGTVSLFRSYIETNRAPVIVVTAISGVTTPKEVSLGPDIKLVPMASLPPSVQRGEAFGQDHFGRSAIPDRASSAITTTIDYGPIFYRPGEGEAPSTKAQERVWEKLGLLDEARCLLTLLGVQAAYRRSWIQPMDPLMSMGITSGSLINLEGSFAREEQIDEIAAKELAAAYFRIPPSNRREALRIPLDRLDRVARNRDITDRTIDLGIALEALLLHDGGRGELKFRLSLRGAWLAGRDQQERDEIQKFLAKLYDLRSTAVHSGSVALTEPNREMIKRGTEVCRLLIRKTIDAEARIDWNALVLGGEYRAARSTEQGDRK
jgi:hypothetical protein